MIAWDSRVKGDLGEPTLERSSRSACPAPGPRGGFAVP